MQARYYQFLIKDKMAAPLREDWTEAAADAVNAGYAQWNTPEEIVWDTSKGGSIGVYHREN